MPEFDIFEARFAATYHRYLDEVPTEVDAADVARTVAVADRRSREGSFWRSPSTTRAVGWVLLLALVLLTAIGAALLIVGARRPALYDLTVLPTGIDVITPDTGAYGRTVVGADGAIWALGDGRLVRFDPASDTAKEWTVSDDAAFGRSGIAVARGGGVWLIEGKTLRRFDGSVLQAVPEAPAELADAAEAPDGSLWAATSTGGRIVHWNGSSWVTFDPGRPSQDAAISTMFVDSSGRVWIGWYQYRPTAPGIGWLSRYDGSRWTTFDGSEITPLSGSPSSIAQFLDGAIWVATERGIARFDGSSWTTITATPGADAAAASVAQAADGTIWAAGSSTGGGAVTIRRFDGRSWVPYGASEGLPSSYGATRMLPTRQGMYAGTGSGIYRYANDHWERAWPSGSTPAYIETMLAVSVDELWASCSIGYRLCSPGLWHWQGGRWTNEPVDPAKPGQTTSAMAIARDGTVWAAGEAGVAYRRDGAWTIVDPMIATGIAVDGETVWAVEGSSVWTLRFDGRTWVRRAVEGFPLQPLGRTTIAIDGTGTAWISGVERWSPPRLARYDGHSWETITELGGASIAGATVLGTAPDGAVWIAAEDPPIPDPARPAESLPNVVRAVRIAGQQQTVVELPDGNHGMGGLLAPDGTLWAQTDRGPYRYDGQRWASPYAGISPSWMGVSRVAPDGTVFGNAGMTILRLPPERN
jgi:hypothetical protein